MVLSAMQVFVVVGDTLMLVRTIMEQCVTISGILVIELRIYFFTKSVTQ